MRALVVLAACAAGWVSGCATPAVSQIRFANRDPVWKVNDRLDTPRPGVQGFPRLFYYFDRFAFRRLTRLMEVPEPRRAANVNSLDVAGSLTRAELDRRFPAIAGHFRDSTAIQLDATLEPQDEPASRDR